ncbi:MAG: hypothetical protein RQ752_13755, partial [Thermohalobaculum sp.]|nr:hypothetical protein [Thermohalobaculum sp.]
WLRRDGDGSDQAAAALRPGLERTRRTAPGALPNGWRVEVNHASMPDPADLARLCAAPRTILIARNAGAAPAGACLFYGRRALARAGAIGVWAEGEGVRVEESSQRAPRLWNRRWDGAADDAADAVETIAERP